MTIGQTTSSDISAEVDAFYDRTLLKPLRSSWIYGRYGQKKSVKDNDTARFSIYPILGTQPVALTEGVTPPAQKLSVTRFTAKVSLYGGYVELTEECDIYRIDAVVAEATERIAWQGADTVDEITRDVLVGGDNVYRANGVAARNEIIAKMTTTDLRVLGRAMLSNKVPFFKNLIPAGTGVGSSSVAAAWFMFIGNEVLYDAEAMTGYKGVEDYATQNGVEENEIGSFGRFRFLFTTESPVVPDSGALISSSGLGTTSGTSVDVHQNVIIGPDAYGVIDADGGMKNVRKDKAQIGGPLELYGTVGWKIRYTAVILEQDRMYRYECGATSV
jgi:N4-gp56 family major capsid protein